MREEISCIILRIYIKPQLFHLFLILLSGCIILRIYIKPQLINRK